MNPAHQWSQVSLCSPSKRRLRQNRAWNLSAFALSSVRVSPFLAQNIHILNFMYCVAFRTRTVHVLYFCWNCTDRGKGHFWMEYICMKTVQCRKFGWGLLWAIMQVSPEVLRLDVQQQSKHWTTFIRTRGAGRSGLGSYSWQNVCTNRYIKCFLSLCLDEIKAPGSSNRGGEDWVQHCCWTPPDATGPHRHNQRPSHEQPSAIW